MAGVISRDIEAVMREERKCQVLQNERKVGFIAIPHSEQPFFQRRTQEEQRGRVFIDIQEAKSSDITL